MGRNAGSRDIGYFYLNGRGWYAEIDGKTVPLRDEPVEPMRRKNTPVAGLREARKRILPANRSPVNGVTVHEVCCAYLEKVKA